VILARRGQASSSSPLNSSAYQPQPGLIDHGSLTLLQRRDRAPVFVNPIANGYLG
jgi:hypothetical protein